jgi:hypothetical protein
MGRCSAWRATPTPRWAPIGASNSRQYARSTRLSCAASPQEPLSTSPVWKRDPGAIDPAPLHDGPRAGYGRLSRLRTPPQPSSIGWSAPVNCGGCRLSRRRTSVDVAKPSSQGVPRGPHERHNETMAPLRMMPVPLATVLPLATLGKDADVGWRRSLRWFSQVMVRMAVPAWDSRAPQRTQRRIPSGSRRSRHIPLRSASSPSGRSRAASPGPSRRA